MNDLPILKDYVPDIYSISNYDTGYFISRNEGILTGRRFFVQISKTMDTINTVDKRAPRWLERLKAAIEKSTGKEVELNLRVRYMSVDRAI